MPYCPECGNQLTGSESSLPRLRAIPPDSPPPALEPSPARPQDHCPWETTLRPAGGCSCNTPAGLWASASLTSSSRWSCTPSRSWEPVASLAVTTPLLMGNFIVSAKLLQGQPPEFRDFFAGFQYFLPLLLLSLVAGLFIGIGTILLIIPGVYLAVAYMFASYLVVDRRLDFWPAMELSRRTVTPRWFGYFAFVLLMALLNLAGVVAPGRGPPGDHSPVVLYRDRGLCRPLRVPIGLLARGPQGNNSLKAQLHGGYRTQPGPRPVGSGRGPAPGPHPDLSPAAGPCGRGPGGQPGPGAGGPPPGNGISPRPHLRGSPRDPPGHPGGPRPHTPVRPGVGAPVPLGGGLLSVSPGGGLELHHSRGGAGTPSRAGNSGPVP